MAPQKHCGYNADMTEREKKDLLSKVFKLAPEERAALAGSLIESLDESVDPDAEAAWAKEIVKRLKDLDSGKVRTISWSEARRRILRSNARASS